MAVINMFKISKNKKDEFVESMQAIDSYDQKIILNDNEYQFTLCADLQSKSTTISWGWVLNEFSAQVSDLFKFPVAILYVEYLENMYAFTFGNAFHKVDKFCDKDFAFNLARKFEYEEIKSTSQTNPNSNRHKVINSYTKSSYLEYDSGEAFLKLKGTIKLEEGFDLFSKSIEVGTSIKFSMDNPCLERIIELIKYVANKYEENDVTSIPLFQEIKDLELIEKLDKGLKENFNFENFNISFSDFDIIGTMEVFYAQNTTYKLMCGNKWQCYDTLNEKILKSFCEEKGLIFNDILFDIVVKTYSDSGYGDKWTVKELIDYNDDVEKCVLLKGVWYKYNDDYLDMLEKSLNELLCYHEKNFDWDESAYNDKINAAVDEYKKINDTTGKTDDEIIKEVKKKHYKEKVYNQIISEKYGYECKDRDLLTIDRRQKIELSDLYKDDCIYAVKIGNTSSKLSYAVTQMSLAMKYIKSGKLKYEYKNVKRLAIVMVLEGKKQLNEDEHGVINVNDLELIALKNSLDTWQKEARHLNYNPEVIIAYKL